MSAGPVAVHRFSTEWRKADLTEDRFKLIVTELAKVFNGGTFDQGAFPDQPHAGITRRPPA